MDGKIDRIFDLVEKVYIELQGTKKEVKQNSNHIIRLENEFHNKMGAMNDKISIIENGVKEIKDKLDIIEDKVEKHDIKIQVIEGGKKKVK